MLSMPSMTPLLLFLHVAGVAVWVGGMFFAYVCLRPVAVDVLEPPPRLRLWRGVLACFFAWVWGAVVVIPASGLAMLLPVGFAAAPRHWLLMLAAGLAMIAIFLVAALRAFPRLRAAVDREDWPAAGAALGTIRRLVGINLALGALTIADATLGRWLAP